MLTDAYLISTKNLTDILDAIRNARAPERFTVRFLENLGFKTTNDRLYIPVLKALGMLDQNGAPTQRYFQFLDDSQWKAVLADGIENAYEDLLRLNKKAYELSRQAIIGKLKSLTEGKKSPAVLGYMATTFLELSKRADFEPKTAEASSEAVEETPIEESLSASPGAVTPQRMVRGIDSMTYRIEVVLPASRDRAVYDAIFRSLREHLL
jgi:hypothetical protein